MSEVAITITADGKAAVLAAKQAGDAIQSLGNQAEQAASHLQAAGKAGSGVAASGAAAKQASEAMQSLGNQAEQAAAHLQAAGKAGSSLTTSGAAAKQASEAMQSLGNQAGHAAAQAQAAGKATADMANRAGMSAKEMAAAMRGIPAQFTDIVTSLASGQAPLTVLLQQGGQLKDQFHGIVPAAKAVGEYVVGLINPFTLAGAAAAAMGYAYFQGRKESALFNEALLTTGNITGTTTGQLNEMAKALGQGEFTRGAAAAALAQMAGTGAIAMQSLQGLGKTALEMQRYVGVPVEETAKVFKALGDEPVKASLQLNDSLHYLTRTQYEQIKSLEEHSRKTEAAALAQQAWSDALKPQIDSARANLGYLETAWSGVAKGAKEAWDSMLNVGRQVNLEDRLAGAKQLLADFERTSSGKRTTEQVALMAKAGGVEGLKGQIAGLEELIDTQKKAAQADAERQKVQEAGIKWSQKVEQRLSNELRLKKEISDIEALGKAANIDPKKIADLVALTRQDYDKAVASANADALITAAKGNAKRYGDYYKQELDAFRLSTADYLEQVRALDTQALQVERRAVAGEKPVTAEDRIRQKSRLSELDAQIREVGEKYNRAVEDNDLKNQQVLERLGQAAGKSLDPMTQAGQTFASQYGAIMRRAATDGNEAILEAGRAVWDSMTDKVQFDSAKKLYEDLFAKLTTELEAVRQAADLDGGLFAHLDAAGKAQEIKKRLLPSIDEATDRMRQFAGTDPVSDKAVVEAEANVKKLTTQADPYFKKMADGLETSLTDALMRGFESGKGFGKNLVDTVKNLFKTLVLRPVVQAVISPVSGALTGALGLGGTSAAIAGQSGGSAAGSALSLAGAASSAYSLLTNGISASIQSGFAKLASNGFGESLGLAQPTGYTTGSGVQYGLNETGSSIGSALGVAGNALAGYGLSKVLSGGYQLGGGGLMNAATLAASAYFGPIAGAVTGLLNRAFGSKLADSGLQGSFGGAAGFTGSNFTDYQGGWLRSDRTDTSALDPALQSGLAQQFKALQVSTGLMATTLGLSSDTVRDFTASIRLSFQGLTEAQIQTKLTEQFTSISEQMAAATLATTDYTHMGETAAQTLTRLSGALSTVNGSFDTLGLTLYQASLKGADMASQLADLFGGLDNFKTATAAYYQAIYTDEERLAKTREQLTTQFSTAFGMAVPSTLEAYKALVSAQDLTTELGRKQYATLMQLAPAFAEVTKAATTAADAAQQQATATLDALRSSGKGISDWLAKIQGSTGSSAVSLASARGQYLQTLNLARGNDQTALGSITGMADSYLQAAKAQATSGAQYAAIVAQVSAEMTALPAVQSYQQQTVERLQAINVAIGLVGADINSLAGVTLTSFQRLDTTADSLLSYDELRQGLAGIATDAQIANLIRTVDVNGDGQISATELVNAAVGSVVGYTSGTMANTASALATSAQQIDALVTMNNDGLVAISKNTALSLDYMAGMRDYLRSINITLASAANTTAASGSSSGGGSVASMLVSGVSGIAGAAVGAVSNAVSSVGNWVSSWFADGDVFGGQGIYSQPTPFMFNGGQLGVMGEAGPEAVMPLERMSDGALGVRALPNYVYSVPTASTLRSDPAIGVLVAEIVALRTAMTGLLENVSAEARATAVNTGKSTRLLQRVTQDGEAMQTVAA